MATTRDWTQELPMPVLLAEARQAYANALRRAMRDGGFDDMPRAGPRVIGRIAFGGTNVSEVAEVYGVSKQAASQLVDTLVARGYVERIPDAEDRRRMLVGLTERGEAAAAEIRAAVEGVDAAFAAAVGPDKLAQARRVLWALVEINQANPLSPDS